MKRICLRNKAFNNVSGLSCFVSFLPHAVIRFKCKWIIIDNSENVRVRQCESTSNAIITCIIFVQISFDCPPQARRGLCVSTADRHGVRVWASNPLETVSYIYSSVRLKAAKCSTFRRRLLLRTCRSTVRYIYVH